MSQSHIVENLPSCGDHSPRTLTFAITCTCNLACSHCWVEADPSASVHVPEQTVLRLLEEYRSVGDGIRFTGGEPLCHPRWPEFLQFATQAGYRRILLQTNGTLLTEDSVSVLRELDFPGLGIQVSLDGARAETHDPIRGEGAFAETLAGLRRLAREDLGKRTTLFFTEMRRNLHEIPDLLRLADTLGIGKVVTGTVVQCGRAAQEEGNAPPDVEQYEQLLARFAADSLFRGLYETLGTVAAIEWSRESLPRSEWCTFAQNPYITAQGLLFPCVMLHAEKFAVKGVFRKTVAAAFAEGERLWSSLRERSLYRHHDSSDCCECPGREVCAGGCMGRAWMSCGDLDGADDRCALRRAIYRHNPFIP